MSSIIDAMNWQEAKFLEFSKNITEWLQKHYILATIVEI